MNEHTNTAKPAEQFPPVICPVCGWKLLERDSHTSGIITAKCGRCRRRVRVNIAWRTARGGMKNSIAAWY